MSTRKPPTKKRFLATWSTVIVLLAVTVVTLNTIIFTQFQTVFDGYFRPSVERSEAVTKASAALTEEIQAEGIVFLKNENNVLPLGQDNRKVNVFGWSSTSPIYGGTGSGAVDVASAVSLLGGLQAAGIEYNTDITDFYTSFRTGRPAIQIRAQDWTIPEPTMAEYDAAGIFESAQNFSNTAIVVVSRSGGEGADIAMNLGGKVGSIEMQTLPDGREVNVGVVGSEYDNDVDASKHYLELSNREEAMVKRVSETFDNVVVLVNTGNVFEMGFVDEYNIDAAAWIGGPGETGFLAVGKFLTGEVNPSGRTVDTWARDLLAVPSVANFGGFNYTGSENADTGDVSISYSGDPATYPGFQFVQYAEGIYLGYRFYETFYAGQEASYNEAVQYPFGYGLSYSSFTQSMTEPRYSGGTVEVDVTVTNTGEAAGKEVVQLYITPPYTDGGIEKSAVNLVAFDKTEMLEPGASQTITLSLNDEDLASFDAKGEGAYVLERGAYELKLGRNAHETFEFASFEVPTTIVYNESNKRSSDAEPATTTFGGRQGDTIVLSRANNFANFTSAIVQAESRAMTPAEEAAVRIELANDTSLEMPTTGAKNGLKLADLVGADYEDARWEDLLDQLSIEEMTTLISLGGYQTKPVESVDKPATIDIDGPQGLSSFLGSSVRAGAYPTAMVIASTWNEKLAERRGEMIGYEALELGVNGWYAPGMNMHRSPFAGRNFEYYSEDPFISARMGAAETGAAQSLGLYPYIKHFVVNDQEKYRNSRLMTWVDEQTLREIYLKPFEVTVKEAHPTAVMSGYNYLGGVWTGGDPALLQDVLRGEWGFRGMVISDYFGDYGYMNADWAISGGTDMMLSTLGRFGATPTSQTPQQVVNMRQASKNILYTVANSNAFYSDQERLDKLAPVNGEITELAGFQRFAIDNGYQPWELFSYIVNAVIAALLVTLAVVKIRKYRKLFPKPGGLTE